MNEYPIIPKPFPEEVKEALKRQDDELLKLYRIQQRGAFPYDDKSFLPLSVPCGLMF